MDVTEFQKNFKNIDVNKPDAVRETLAAAYGELYANLVIRLCVLMIVRPLQCLSCSGFPM